MHSSFCRGFLSLLAVFNLLSADLVTYQGEELADLVYSKAIDLTADGSSTVLYVRLCEWTLMDSVGSNKLLSMTRYCYCKQPASMDQSDSTCSYPGPTLLMHSYTSVTLKLVNEVVGSQTQYGPLSTYWNQYKDMDITNLHVHGLHVSPFVDDVIFSEAKPMPTNASDALNGIFDFYNNTWTYNYDIYYHYPGTYWYHAHHHGSTTWQVTMGLHGTILMNPWDDSRYEPTDDQNNTFYDIGKYPQDVLMFEWFYAIDEALCKDDVEGCSKDLPDDANWEYTPRFTNITYRPDENYTNAIDDFQTCDIWCSMPRDQRYASEYDYDVYVDLHLYPQCTGNQSLPDTQCMFFFTNGQYQPTLKGVKINEYRRLRMVNSMANWYMQLLFPDTCEWYLIATDGIYTDGENLNYPLNSTSHQNELIMSPGGRADVLYRCTVNGTHNITTSRNFAMDKDQLPKMSPRVYADRTMLTIQVDGVDIPEPLPDATAYPPKPADSYVGAFTDPNTTTKTCEQGDKECEFSLYLIPGNTKKNTSTRYYINDVSYSIAIGESFMELVNNSRYNLGTFHINSDGYEFIINDGPRAHPYHQHINPFNVRYGVGNNSFIALPNTWWDTLGNYGGPGGGITGGRGQNITARMWTRGSWTYPNDTFIHKKEREYFGTGGGLVIVHCHMLQHEDKGMMGFYGIINSTSNASITITAEEEEVDSDDSTVYIVLYVFLAVIILALIIFAIYYLVKKKSAASSNQSNLAQTQSTEGGATVATSGSIESAEAGSTEMVGTAK